MKSAIVPIIVSIALIAGACVFLLWDDDSLMDDSVVYYHTVDEVLGNTPMYTEKTIRINGVLMDNSLRQKPGTDEYVFKLAKKGQSLEVMYTGFIPDAMQDGREIVVHGKLDKSNRFNAIEILTKCPSKYEAEAKARN